MKDGLAPQVLPLINHNYFFWSSNFKTKEKLEPENIFDAKLLIKEEFDILNLCHTITSKHYVINISQQRFEIISIRIQIKGMVYLRLSVPQVK